MLTYIPIPPFEFARGGASQGWAKELGTHGPWDWDSPGSKIVAVVL